MKIRRYKERIATDWILDEEMGDWCRYEDVEPLLERIEELKRYYNGDIELLLRRINELEAVIEELEERQCPSCGFEY